MCGIAGFLSLSVKDAKHRLRRMAESLRHRGPDDDGHWADAEHGVGLAHTRLAIIDLSPSGHQPMHSGSGRYVMVYNGEVYNYLEIQAELRSAGHTFRGSSDTEVILAAFDQWTVNKAIERLDGMFAIAVWDRFERQLHLIRDRLGIKPLFYGWLDGEFFFASELKAIRSASNTSPDMDRHALAAFMRFAYVPAPRTIYRDVFKLAPGSVVTIDHDVSPATFSPLADADGGHSPERYWSVSDVWDRGRREPFSGSPSDAVSVAEGLVRNAVSRRMIADVSLGAFLSGGVDSSTIVAIMQSLSTSPVRTFTIRVEGHDYDESPHAEAVARHLGTDHSTFSISSTDALSVVPKLADLYDEPFADSSQIPTYLVCQAARRHVTVCLSGDGGDEVFAGYNRYSVGVGMFRRSSRLPLALRRALCSGIHRVPTENWYGLMRRLSPVLPNAISDRVGVGRTVTKFTDVFGAADLSEMYRSVTSTWRESDEVFLHPDILYADEYANRFSVSKDNAVRDMMLLDLQTYHPDDILAKVDRASMGVSLEVRVPLIDHHLIEFVASLQPEVLLKDSVSKWVIRQILSKYVPRELWDAPKRGFTVPIGAWLRGPLRDWADDLLSVPRMQRDGFFNAATVSEKWKEHRSGKQDWANHLWCVLMFQAWTQRYLPESVVQ